MSINNKIINDIHNLFEIMQSHDFDPKYHICFPIYSKDNSTIKCYTLLDKNDLFKIHKYVWRLCLRGYPKAKINRKDIYIHRYIMNESDPNIIIDHINRNPLDNRKKNLRKGTRSQNSANRMKIKLFNNKPTSSIYKGVFKFNNNKFLSYIKFKGNKIDLGYFKNEKDAAKEYNKHAKKLFGKFSVLNIL